MLLPVLLLAVLLEMAALEAAEAREQAAHEESNEVRLQRDLMQSYDSLAVPTLGFPTEVNLTLGVKHVTVNELLSAISMNAWMKVEWVDSRLRWRTRQSDYGNLTTVTLYRSNVWYPNIVVKNGFSGKSENVATYENSLDLSCDSDGRLQWVPSVLFETYCDLDLRRWPFERHQCSLTLGSWTLDAHQLAFSHAKCSLDELNRNHGEFAIESVEMNTIISAEEGSARQYWDVVFTFILQRQGATYRAVIFIPAFVVVLLCLATFLLPPRSGEKIVLGGVNAVLICVFLIYFAHSLPVLTNQTPLVVIFYSSSLYLVCFSLVVTVFVLNISRPPHSKGIPVTLKKVLTGTYGRGLLLGSYIQQVCAAREQRAWAQDELPVVLEDGMEQEREPEQEQEPAAALDPQADWLLLAAAIDRTLFLVYSLVFVALAIAFHV